MVEKNVDRMPGATSGIISNEARLPNKAKTTRNHTTGIMPSIKSVIKIPFLPSGNNHLGMIVKMHGGRHEDCSVH